MLLLLLPIARADYVAPLPHVMVTEATSVADVTVTRLDDDQHAQITVNRLLRGEEPPAEITGVWLTCGGGPPGMYGIEGDTRYIVILHEDLLYEESSYFEVRGDQCHAWGPDEHTGKTWQPCSEVLAWIQPDAPQESLAY